MDFRQITMMQKIKSGMDRFRANHPKIPAVFTRRITGRISRGINHRDQCYYTGREKLLYQCQAESR